MGRSGGVACGAAALRGERQRNCEARMEARQRRCEARMEARCCEVELRGG
jgi:hypothetical protein